LRHNAKRLQILQATITIPFKHKYILQPICPQGLTEQQAAAYNPFDIGVFQFADYLKYFLSFTNRNSMISAAAVIMQITPTQQTVNTTKKSTNVCRTYYSHTVVAVMCLYKPLSVSHQTATSSAK